MLKYFYFFLVAALLSSCSRKTDQVQPTVGRVTESIYASGVIKSLNQYEVYSTVSGLVQDIMVNEGDPVHRGDAIMRLVDENARLNMEQARLAAQYASFAANRDKLRELELNRDAAWARMEHEKSMLGRQRSLWAQGIGTRNELDALELAATISANAYHAANLRYRDFSRQLTFQSLQSQKSLQLSESMADDYLIRSTVDGKVYRLLKERGELITPQNPVALVGDAEGFILELQVDEYDIIRIRKGQKVLLHLDSYKGQVFEAEIEQIDPAMNTQSRSFTVKATFTKAPAVLYPNLSCEANIIIQVKEHALTIPRNCLIGDSVVMLASGRLRKVRTGLMDYQKAEILEGLSTKDIILQSDHVK